MQPLEWGERPHQAHIYMVETPFRVGDMLQRGFNMMMDLGTSACYTSLHPAPHTHLQPMPDKFCHDQT